MKFIREWFRHLIYGPTDAEIAKITSPKLDIPHDHSVPWDGYCPDCGGQSWYEGPSGGMCQNIECGDCGTRLNAVMMPGMLMAHRIGPRKNDQVSG